MWIQLPALKARNEQRIFDLIVAKTTVLTNVVTSLEHIQLSIYPGFTVFSQGVNL